MPPEEKVPQTGTSTPSSWPKACFVGGIAPPIIGAVTTFPTLIQMLSHTQTGFNLSQLACTFIRNGLNTPLGLTTFVAATRPLVKSGMQLLPKQIQVSYARGLTTSAATSLKDAEEEVPNSGVSSSYPIIASVAATDALISGFPNKGKIKILREFQRGVSQQEKERLWATIQAVPIGFIPRLLSSAVTTLLIVNIPSAEAYLKQYTSLGDAPCAAAIVGLVTVVKTVADTPAKAIHNEMLLQAAQPSQNLSATKAMASIYQKWGLLGFSRAPNFLGALTVVATLEGVGRLYDYLHDDHPISPTPAPGHSS